MAYHGKMSIAEANRILGEEAQKHQVAIADVLARVKRAKNQVSRCRVEISRRLSTLGASTVQIGNFLGVNSSTISYYLGRCSRGRPAEPARPIIRRYKVPYAGADRDYQPQPLE